MERVNMYKIYEIVNKDTGRRYIGSTNNIKRRKARHKTELKHGHHSCKALQKDYNELGWEGFCMRILEDNFTKEEAHSRETALIQESYDTNYNVSKSAKGGDLITYHPDREALLKGRHERVKALTEKERSDIWGLKGERNGMWGKKHSEETRKRISEKVGRAGKDNSFYGKKHSEETKKKLSESNTSVRITIDGVEYMGYNAGSEATGLTVSQLRYRVNSPKYPNIIAINTSGNGGG